MDKEERKAPKGFRNRAGVQHLSFYLDGACKNGLPGGRGLTISIRRETEPGVKQLPRDDMKSE